MAFRPSQKLRKYFTWIVFGIILLYGAAYIYNTRIKDVNDAKTKATTE